MINDSTASEGKAPDEGTDGEMSLTSLPLEILGTIVEQILHKEDLSKLSRTCKTMKTISFPKLYSQLVLKIPPAGIPLTRFETFLASTGEGLQHVTSLRITTDLHKKFVEADDIQPEVCGGTWVPDWIADARLNSFVRIILMKLPMRHLTEFMYVCPGHLYWHDLLTVVLCRWDHGCEVEKATLSTILSARAPGLTKLKTIEPWDDIDKDFSGTSLKGLQSLSISSFESENSNISVAIMHSQSKTLKHLCLGAEYSAFRFHHEAHEEHEDICQDVDNCLSKLITQIVDTRKREEEENRVLLPNSGQLAVSTLELIGLKVSMLITPNLSFQDWGCLTSLSLESCRGLESAFSALETEKNREGLSWRGSLRLHSFYIRLEFCSSQLRAKVLDFLSSISGLVNLSILLESSHKPKGFKEVLETHGKTLQTLVLEERAGPQKSYISSHGKGLSLSQQLKDIAGCCPKLVALGVLFNWSRLQDGLYGTRLKSMRNLRTLNIRNMPSFDPTAVTLPRLKMQAFFVNSVLDAIAYEFDRRHECSAGMALKTLAIGSLTYQNLRNGLGHENDTNLELYQFLRLQIYRIEHWHQFGGQRKPIATLSETGTYEKLEAEGEDITIFKPYWLA
ncbi:MAG: hypothetical protein Q9170_006626 [Blastenia crenularia]